MHTSACGPRRLLTVTVQCCCTDHIASSQLQMLVQMLEQEQGVTILCIRQFSRRVEDMLLRARKGSPARRAQKYHHHHLHHHRCHGRGVRRQQCRGGRRRCQTTSALPRARVPVLSTQGHQVQCGTYSCSDPSVHAHGNLTASRIGFCCSFDAILPTVMSPVTLFHSLLSFPS